MPIYMKYVKSEDVYILKRLGVKSKLNGFLE